MTVSVCLCCGSISDARVSQKRQAQTVRNFLYTLPVEVSQSTSDDRAVCYVLPVLWMTSCFHILFDSVVV